MCSFVVWRGDLQRDCKAMELQVFSTRELRAGRARPVRSVSVCSARSNIYYQGIVSAHWEDSDAIQFICVEGSGPRQVCRLAVASGAFERLTDAQYDVGMFRHAGGALWFTAIRPRTNNALGQYPYASLHSDELVEWNGTDYWKSELYVA